MFKPNKIQEIVVENLKAAGYKAIWWAGVNKNTNEPIAPRIYLNHEIGDFKVSVHFSNPELCSEPQLKAYITGSEWKQMKAQMEIQFSKVIENINQSVNSIL